MELENLSKEEQELALKILQEYSQTGTSESYKNLLLEDWKEIPVDIETFLHDEDYLGKGLINGEGKFTLYPYWEDLLHKIYPDPLKPATCNTLVLTGAIGIGKSTEAVVICLYELYRMMCLRDPYVYYGIMNSDVISFAVINITLDAAQGVAWSKLQNLIQMSPWFCRNGQLSKGDVPTWRPDNGVQIELICGSQPRHFIGRALYFSFFDEISFITNKDVEEQKRKATELISSATARMQSRFMRNDINPTIMVLASSKRTEQSFLETWIARKKETESKTTYIVDEPQWVIRDDKKSKITFKVAVGNKFMNSEVLPLNPSEETVRGYQERGYRLLDVPIGYYENFLDDIDIALTDIAGISTTALSNFISGERLVKAKLDGLVNPFTKDVIEVGNGPDDLTQYYDYFDLTKIPHDKLKKPLFIHLDMSLSGDKTGIAGVWLVGKNEQDEPLFQLAFSVSVKAPKGYQVSFEKTRKFIYYLTSKGFAIKYITMDTFQSADMLQALRDNKYNAEVLSVDRVDKSDIGSMPVCKPYNFLKNIIYEKRIAIPKKGTQLLTDELVGLERNNSSGKVDHSPRGINSKDQADAVCGAAYTAGLHVNEFVLDYSKFYSDFLEVNTVDDNPLYELESTMKKQMNVYTPPNDYDYEPPYGDLLIW